MMIDPWGKSDREKLAHWLSGNAYRAAFLVHAAPVKANTLERILRGYHDPGALLAARIRDLLERYPRGTPLPHAQALICG